MDDSGPTVFIVEDSHDVCVALARMLTSAGCQVRSFESAECFLSDQDVATPGCLLLDVGLPGLSGIELQHQLAALRCARPIIFITGAADIQTSVRAMKQGAIDFLTKPIDPETLLAAIEQALRRDAQQRAEHAIYSMIDQRIQTLTKRERQVLEHVLCGQLNKQIAADLGIGEKTVKVHRARVMSKMTVRSVAQLVQLCARVGITEGPPGWCTGAAVLNLPSIDRPSVRIRGIPPPRASM
jgi:FixJ family two-component response regulator